MRFITLFSIIWLSIVCQPCLNASDAPGENSGSGVVNGNVPTKAELMANVEENDPIQEANAVQSEGHELPLFHEHVHPQRQSSVMPGRRKRQAPQVTGVPRGPAPQVTGVGRRKRRQTDRMVNVEEAGPTQEAKVVTVQSESEGSEFAASLNAQLSSGQHFQPQKQSSVMPRRKRQSPSIIVQPRPSIIVKPRPTPQATGVGRRKRRQTVEEGAEGNGAQEKGGNSNSNQVHYVIAPGDGLEFTCQAGANVQQIQQNEPNNQMSRSQGKEMDAQNSGNKVAGAGAIPVISGNTLRVVCKV